MIELKNVPTDTWTVEERNLGLLWGLKNLLENQISSEKTHQREGQMNGTILGKGELGFRTYVQWNAERFLARNSSSLKIGANRDLVFLKCNIGRHVCCG